MIKVVTTTSVWMSQNGTKGPGPTVPDWQLDGHADDLRCSFLYLSQIGIAP